MNEICKECHWETVIVLFYYLVNCNSLSVQTLKLHFIAKYHVNGPGPIHIVHVSNVKGESGYVVRCAPERMCIIRSTSLYM